MTRPGGPVGWFGQGGLPLEMQQGMPGQILRCPQGQARAAHGGEAGVQQMFAVQVAIAAFAVANGGIDLLRGEVDDLGRGVQPQVEIGVAGLEIRYARD